MRRRSHDKWNRPWVPGQVPHLLGGPGSAGVLAAGGEQDAPAGQVHPRAAGRPGVLRHHGMADRSGSYASVERPTDLDFAACLQNRAALSQVGGGIQAVSRE